MISTHQARELPGRTLLDRDGARIGPIGQVFADAVTDEPTWVTVRTGWFGSDDSFVPVSGLDPAGAEPRTIHGADTIRSSPRFTPDGPLTRSDEDRLRTHYESAAPTEKAERSRHEGAAGRAGALAIAQARVCPTCGCFVADDMAGRHEEFHRAMRPPAGDDARHDVNAAGQT